MPQVPYTGVPQVAPQDTPIPRYQADAGPAAFGVNIAQATQHLGQTAEGAGSELFARGLAMQDLYNHSEAQQADADYMQKSGELHAQYSSLEGKAAVDAYPKYIQDLQDARTGIRDNLSNGMSQKLFDGSSLSTMGRTIFNGAGHAATQNKQYALGASKARVAAMGDQALSTPADSDAFQDSLADTEDEVRAQGLLQGADPDSINQAVAQEKSKLWGNRLQGMVKQQPFQADTLFKQAVKDGEIRGEDIGKLSNLINDKINTVGARNVAHDVMTGAGNRFGGGTVDIRQAARAIKTLESGGNYDTQVDTGSKHGVALGAYGFMSGFLPEFLREAGMPPMSSADFLKDHDAQDTLFANRFTALMKETGSANGAAARWIGTKGKDAFGTDANTYVSRFNVALAHNAPLSDKLAVGQQIASDHSIDNPLFPEAVQRSIETLDSDQKRVKQDDIWQARQPIENALVSGMQGGKIPTTVDELTADPQVSAAWDQLNEKDPARARYYLNILARNAKGDHALTPETLKQYTQLTGEAIQRPADFVNENILDTNLPISKKVELIKLQQSIQGKTDKGNPAVQQAMHDSAGMILAAGIDGKDKENLDQFTGALADQLRQWSQDNQKPPNYEDRQLITARLLQNFKVPGRYFGTNEYPLYQVPVPPDIAASAKALDPTLSDIEIQRRYTRKYYQKQFGSTPKAATPTVATSQ